MPPRGLITTRAAGPGLAASLAGVACGLLVAASVPSLSALVVAMVIGVAAGNLGLLGPWAEPGIRVARTQVLRVGIVLLGFRLSLGDVVDLGGPPGIVLIIIVVALTFLGTRLVARRLGLSEPLGLLLATGFAICGASAIAAVQPLAEADEDETALAIGLVTLFGTLAMFTLPALGRLVGLTAGEAGYWAGASVHDVAQVVATASTSGSGALEAAVIVKLSRVVLLAPLLVAVSIGRRRAAGAAGDGDPSATRPPIVPLFVVLFLVAAALRSTGVLDATTLSLLELAEKLCLAAAMFGLGATVRFARLRRLGHRPLLVGALSWLIVAGVSLPVALFISP